MNTHKISNKIPTKMITTFIMGVLILSTIFVSMAMSVHAALLPNVMVSEFSVKNGEMGVGKNFILVLTLKNTEPAACAFAVSSTLQANPPFIMNGVNTASSDKLCFGETKIIEFPMRIDPTANGGSYQLTISNTYETSLLAQFSNSNTITVFVNGTPNINAHIVGSAPVDVYPGDTATITVNVQNDGSFAAQSVSAKLIAPSPLEAKWSGSYASLGTLDAKQGKNVVFTVEVPKNAAAKDYPVSLELNYQDETLSGQKKEFPLTFHVTKKAFFETTPDGSDALYANDNLKVYTLYLKNTGTDAARKVKVKLQPMFPFSTDGSVRYVELLEPGKSVPVDFVVNIDKDATVGSYGLDLILDFEDEQGKTLHDTAKVSLAVESKSIFRAVVLDYWFLWVVIAFVAFMIIKKKSAKKSDKK